MSLDTSNDAYRELCLRTRAFAAEAARRGLGDASLFFWYHVVDLGDGLITPGSFDYRATLAQFHFPEDLRGMQVLDIGSATGFFAFEFERRGAEVVSVEVPSMAALDGFPGEATRDKIAKLERMVRAHSAYTDEEVRFLFRDSSEKQLWHHFIDGPFQLCMRALGSKLRRVYSTVYDLSPATVGREAFDLVFVGDVLLHVIDPLRALAACAALSRGTLMISQPIPPGGTGPAMVWVGGEEFGSYRLSWWLPNEHCLVQILHKLGFPEVRVAGRPTVTVEPIGHVCQSTVLHASRPARG
jgi:2-polyprenyl-3-methyl-5-hydroxy-6-metoxy-1,4-benzoquinol methylase